MINWNFTARAPTGGAPLTIPRGLTFVDGLDGRGIRARLTPDGDCVEMTFDAVGRDLALTPLTALQFNVDFGGTLIPVFFGEIRQGGNLRDVDGHTYTVRGMSARLGEVTLSPEFSTPKQAAHLTVRTLIQDVITSGQLGSPSLVTYDEALCPDLGFDCRKVVDAMQQPPAALLRQIQEDGAAMGVQVRWGVRPDGKFFCTVARTTVRDVTLEAPEVEWKPPIAETPCTAVLWWVAKRPDGTWITHLSRSPDAAVYGDRVTALSVPATVPSWKTVPATIRLRLGATSPNLQVAGSQPTFDLTTLTDGATAANAAQQVFSSASNYVLIEVFGNGVERVVYAGQSLHGYLLTGLKLPDANLLTANVTDQTAAGWATGTRYVPPGRAAYFVNATHDSANSTEQLSFAELRAEAVDTDLLDGLAEFHYRSPAQEPAEIQTTTPVAPLQLPGRVRLVPPDGPAYEHALEAVEYRLTDDGLLMGWLAGQADDPTALAQAELIRRSDRQAVITAVTATT